MYTYVSIMRNENISLHSNQCIYVVIMDKENITLRNNQFITMDKENISMLLWINI